MYSKIILNIIIVFFITLKIYSAELNIFSSNNSPLNPNELHDIAIDSTNSIWIINNLNIYTLTNGQWIIRNPNFKIEGIWDICVSPKNETWFALNDLLISYYDGKWDSVKVNHATLIPWHLYFNTDTTLWMTLYNSWPHFLGLDYLGIFEQGEITIKRPSNSYGLYDFIVYNDTTYAINYVGIIRNYKDDWEIIYPLENDKHGELFTIEKYRNTFFAGGEILIKYDNYQFNNIGCIDTFLIENKAIIESICIQNEKTIWLGTNKGSLLKYDSIGFQEILKFDNHLISDIEIDKNNNIWFVIGDLGLAVFNENNLVNVELNQSNSIFNDFILSQNYPNPFNPRTNIMFTLPYPAKIKLTIYNNLGNEIKILTNDYKQEGSYNYIFDGTNISSGVYYYSLEYNNSIFTKKMLLIK